MGRTAGALNKDYTDARDELARRGVPLRLVSAIIDASTNGNINLNEIFGDFRVGAITSTSNNVTLTADLSIVDAQGDTAMIVAPVGPITGQLTRAQPLVSIDGRGAQGGHAFVMFNDTGDALMGQPGQAIG